jgi:hypothetical protein
MVLTPSIAWGDAAMPKKKRSPGRPKSEASTIVNVRVPLSLLARLDRYLDHLEVTTGLSTNRGSLMRNALRAFLDTQGY